MLIERTSHRVRIIIEWRMKIQHGVNNLWESIRIHMNIKNGSGSKIARKKECYNNNNNNRRWRWRAKLEAFFLEWIPIHSAFVMVQLTGACSQSPNISSITIQKHLRFPHNQNETLKLFASIPHILAFAMNEKKKNWINSTVEKVGIWKKSVQISPFEYVDPFTTVF